MKFKELRGLALGLILALIDAYLIIFNMINGNKSKMIIGLLLSIFVFVILVFQFYIHVQEYGVVLYHFVAIALLPTLIEYKDLVEIELKNKYHVILKTKYKIYHAYVFNALKFKDTLMEMKNQASH